MKDISERKIDKMVQEAEDMIDSDLSRAEKIAREALELSNELDYAEGSIKTVRLIALCDWRTGEYRIAISKFSEALRISEEINSTFSGEICNQIGSVYESTANFEKSLEFYLKALSYAEKLDQKDLIITVLFNISMTYRKLSDNEKALDFLQKRFDLSGNNLDQTEEAGVLNEFAINYITLGKQDEALSLFNRSLTYYRKAGNILGAAKVLTSITNLHQSMNNYELAEKTNKESIELNRQLNNRNGMVQSLFAKGGRYLQTGKYANAVKPFEEGLKIAGEIESKQLIYHLHLALSKTYNLMGEYERALTHYRIFHKLKEDIYNKESARKIKKLTAEFETEKAQREAEIHRLKNIELTKAQSIARLGSWEMNNEKGEINGSEEFFKILGISNENGIITNEIFFKTFEGKDQFKLKDILNRIKTEPADELLNLKRNNEEITVRIQCHLDDDEGRSQPVIIGTLHDITDRIKKEKELRQHRDHLEELVKQRTEELTTSRDQLKKLAAHLQTVREEERAMVAREVHDELGQVLTALKFDISWLDRQLSMNQEEIHKKTLGMSELIDSTINTVRKIATKLRPKMIDELGLISALRWHAGEFSGRTGIVCDINTDIEEIDLDEDRSIAVYRVFQEALNNIARHAEAKNVTISLEKKIQAKSKSKDAELILKIMDDGVGIPMERVFTPDSIGLTSMRERAEQFGGETRIQSQPGKGTSVVTSLRLPHHGRKDIIRVLMADDHPVVREGLKNILSSANDIEVVDETDGGQEVLKLVASKEYDVITLDVSMPGIGGLEALKYLKSSNPKVRVLVISMHPEEQYALRAIKAGASGYLTKDSAPDKLVDAVRKIGQGLKYITPSLAEQLANAFETDFTKPITELLSDREYQVMLRIARGKTNVEIGEELILSSKTISTYRGRILKKLNLKKSKDLIQFAIDHGLLE